MSGGNLFGSIEMVIDPSLPPETVLIGGKLYALGGGLRMGGPMRRYGDIVRSCGGVTLMVIRRVSGFAMRRPDQWECYALDADIDPGNRIGHWKDEELA